METKEPGNSEDQLTRSRSHARRFFAWYQSEHKHSGLARRTPEDVHYGWDREKLAERNRVLARAHKQHTERFVNGTPVVDR